MPDAVLVTAGITEALDFSSVASVEPAEYTALVETFGLKITARSTETIQGDAHFTWFAPEQGHVATHWIQTLVDNQVVLPAFVAAVAAADLKNPIFSTERAKLLKFVPPNFTVIPGEAHPDALTRAVIRSLREAQPQPGSVEAEFLAMLEAVDPVAAVRARVIEYRDRIARDLSPKRLREAMSFNDYSVF